MVTVKQQADQFFRQLSIRRRNPAKPATLSAYHSYLRTWILPELGELPIEDVQNDTLKQLVAKLADNGLSASTITGVTNCVKSVVGSAVDRQGNELYPRKWNNDFIDLPIIDPKLQKAPILSRSEVRRAILAATGRYQTLFILLAGSGLRISEAMALKAQPDRQSSYLDRERSVLVIRKQIYRGLEQDPKTDAGIREVDLQPALVSRLVSKMPDNGYILTGTDRPMRPQSAYDAASRAKVPGFHSFRRFRITHLQNQGVPDGLIKFWAGHEGKDITDRYVKFGTDIEARKQWAEKAGLGFEL